MATSESAAVTTQETPPSAQPSAPKTPFDAAAKVVRQIQLNGIHFIACSAEAIDPAAVDDPKLNLSASTRFLVPTVTTSDEGFTTRTTLLFQMKGKRDNDDGDEASLAVIKATLEAVYSLKPNAPSFTDDERRDFALCYCPFHVWGYWREFVQSSLARLDLPQMTIPLFLIDQAPRMVREKLD